MYVSISTQTRHSAAEVPLEVWQIVASFLSSEDVKKLYGINRPLSALAMEERYRSVSIGDLHDRQIIRVLQRLAYVHCLNHFVLYEPPSPTFRYQTSLAEYVRVLNFRPAPLGGLPSLNRSGKSPTCETAFVTEPNTVLNIIRNLSFVKTLKKSPRRETALVTEPKTVLKIELPTRQTAFVTNPETVLNIISNLSLVTSLTLDCEQSPGYPTSFKESLPFVAAGWASFGQNLRFLRLKVPVDAVHDTIGSVKLPNLQGLSFDFSLWSRAMAGSQVFVNFIHDHADTLRFLGIYTREYPNLFETLLQDVCIPMLDSFTFYQAPHYEEINTAGLQPFLLTHSRTLKILDLQFHSYNPNILRETWITMPVTLPKLQSLVVDFWFFSDDHIKCGLDYVVRYSHTLVSLDVSPAPCSYDQIYRLATQFSIQGRLQKLGLTAETLTPQLLILLSSKLPFLEDLTLKFYGLATQEGQIRDHYAEEAEVSLCCHSVTH